MFFQIEISDPKKLMILRDVMTFENITVMKEVATGIMEKMKLDDKLESGFLTKISSENGTHFESFFESVTDVSRFKDEIYEFLISREMQENDGP